ncbi:hypothetical protein ABVW88_26415 (plasmid) [Enterobacter cloacae subsp. cloacae]|uniref:hypothetical protein n=6 Tax=Enterobacterales TaxID=91347 RepID=UPI00345A3AA5
MNEVLSDRKNKGNVTYRIVVSEDATRLFIELEKLMKVRSKEADKKTTKKIVFQKSFYYEEFSNVKDEIDDPILLKFYTDTIVKKNWKSKIERNLRKEKCSYSDILKLLLISTCYTSNRYWGCSL